MPRFQGFPAMKKDIHPKYHDIKVVMTDGTEYTTRSTYGEPGAVLHLDIDPKTHPAWTGGGQHIIDRGGASRASRTATRAFWRAEAAHRHHCERALPGPFSFRDGRSAI